MTIDPRIKSTARRAAAGGASRSAVVLRQAGTGSARVTAIWADRLDDYAVGLAPRVSRRFVNRRVGLALLVLVAVAVIALMLGKRSSRGAAPADVPSADLTPVQDERSAS